MKTKIALITGGSRGLGKSMALHLARSGVDIILTYHSKEAEAHAVVTEIEGLGRRACALQLDTSNPKGFSDFSLRIAKALKENWQREHFDYLVNNAGIGINKPFTQMSEEDFDQLYSIHLKGVYFLTQRLLPLIEDGGRILNVSSGLARFSLPGYSAYAAMKGAIEVLTRYLAKELGGRKIAVNVIAPGAIETDFQGGEVRDNKAVNAAIASHTALGRVGQPDDIGAAVASLLRPDNNWMNGVRIEVSGGMFL